MTITRTRIRCRERACPWPFDEEFHEVPWCRGIKEHKCFGGVTHQHFPKRSQGGKEIVALLCAGAHDIIDNGSRFSNDVIERDGQRIYRILHEKRGVLYERDIGQEGRNELVAGVADRFVGDIHRVSDRPLPELAVERDIGGRNDGRDVHADTVGGGLGSAGQRVFESADELSRDTTMPALSGRDSAKAAHRRSAIGTARPAGGEEDSGGSRVERDIGASSAAVEVSDGSGAGASAVAPGASVPSDGGERSGEVTSGALVSESSPPSPGASSGVLTGEGEDYQRAEATPATSDTDGVLSLPSPAGPSKRLRPEGATERTSGDLVETPSVSATTPLGEPYTFGDNGIEWEPEEEQV